LNEKGLCVKRCVTPHHSHIPNFESEIQIDVSDPCDIQDCYYCLCTQQMCKKLFLIKHIKSNTSFAIGSECFARISEPLAEQNEEFEKYYNATKCSKCQVKLFSKSNSYGDQNTHSSFQDSDKNPYCLSCYKFRYINTQKVLNSFHDENDIEEIVKYLKHEYKCKTCKTAMYFKTTSNHIANASIIDKNECKSCIQIQEKQEENKIKEAQRLHEDQLKEAQRVHEEQLKEAQRLQEEKLKESERLNAIIQFKKDRIIRKQGFYNKYDTYTSKCKKCNEIYNYMNSENNDSLCISCFKTNIN
jgi:hypothetical protein